MHLSLVEGINPTITERFLQMQPSVIDASVWYTRGHLKAVVTIEEGSGVEVARLQEKCEVLLGSSQTPNEITLAYAGRQAA
ncbi:MAG: hypothetical protein ABL962_12035 [Fimbriimonadaceae bacterium]